MFECERNTFFKYLSRFYLPRMSRVPPSDGIITRIEFNVSICQVSGVLFRGCIKKMNYKSDEIEITNSLFNEIWTTLTASSPNILSVPLLDWIEHDSELRKQNECIRKYWNLECKSNTTNEWSTFWALGEIRWTRNIILASLFFFFQIEHENLWID